MKVLTRAEMKRAAMALMEAPCLAPYDCYRKAAKKWQVPMNEINSASPRYNWGFDHLEPSCVLREDEEASMLLSEAYRPAGHDGDGRDD